MYNSAYVCCLFFVYLCAFDYDGHPTLFDIELDLRLDLNKGYLREATLESDSCRLIVTVSWKQCKIDLQLLLNVNKKLGY